MGQKVNPVGFRLGVNRTWESRWYAKKEYADLVKEDYLIRKYIKNKLYYAGISKIEIERAGGRIVVNIYTAKPGIIIGKKGSEVDLLRRDLSDITKSEIYINPVEIVTPELDAQLVAEAIATQLEKRVSHKRAIKKAVASSLNAGAKGIKIMVGGRIAGAEIARREWFREGRVPLQTLRASIDYGSAESFTTYGRIGVKVWIYKGDILGKDEQAKVSSMEEAIKEEGKENVVPEKS